MKVLKELEDKTPSIRAHEKMSYAAAAADEILSPGTQSTHGVKAVPVEAQREIIVSTRNPLKIPNSQAMNPRSLQFHIERALNQS